MYCSRCGGPNDADARYCEKCGTDMSGMPRPEAGAVPPAAGSAPSMPPPAVYHPAQRHVWWYPIGVWVILAGFFAFIDIVATGRLTWSVYPIGIFGIFMVGFPLLHLIEDRAARSK